MNNEVVKVKRDSIAACMTCPLCNKLLRDANTISQCLHTFCRKCIYEKITEEEIESCPICDIDLGIVPMEKLRPDNTLQDVRSKIFPFKRTKVKAPKLLPVTLPSKRKERSLSSLVVSTPKVPTQATITGRRTKSLARRKPASLQGSGFYVDRTVKKDEDSADDRRESSISPETLNKLTQNIRQVKKCSSSAERSQPAPYKEIENGVEEPCEAKPDQWKPLNFLLEVANRTKPFRTNSQGSDSKSDSKHVADNEGQVNKSKFKENKYKSKVEEEKIGIDPVCSDIIEPKKAHRIRPKKTSVFGDSAISLQSVLDAASAKYERQNGPIWFNLVAAEEQKGDAPLPQIEANYLRIKDGRATVSSIQKYLTMKLDIASENEVEIKCMGQTVVPTLQLRSLIDLWLQTASMPERVSATIGSSGKDFVMVLTYGRSSRPVIISSFRSYFL